MAPLLDRIQRTIFRHNLIPRDGCVIAAVSGGSDSVALAHLLHRVSGPGAFGLVGLAHLNHQLRGESADADEEFCRALAAELALPIHVEVADVRLLARERRTSIEGAARDARLAFFSRVASETGADRVAVGHTRDDQAETFLLRLVRGAGTRGLSGVYPRYGVVVRPLLDVSREELRGFLRTHGIPFREDETNDDLSIPRNRVRRELIPYLQEHFSPAIADVLAREAEIARADADWLDSAANTAARTVVSLEEDLVRVDTATLREMPPAIARRVAMDAMKHGAPRRFFGFDHVETFGRLVTGEIAAASLPGLRAVREGNELVLVPAASPPSDAEVARCFCYSLSIPGQVGVAEAGLTVSAERFSKAAVPDLSRLASRGSSVAVDAVNLADALTVRSRQPGDTFRPLGLRGSKKLQDLFVDRKIPRRERDRIPLVVDPTGRIVWIVGQAVSEDFRVTEGTRSVILLKAKHLGGIG